MNFHEKQKLAFENLKNFLLENGYTEVEKQFPYFRFNDPGILLHTHTTDFSDYPAKYVFITTSTVYLFGKHTPYNYTNWHILRQRNYSSKEELLEFINDFIIDKNSVTLWI